MLILRPVLCLPTVARCLRYSVPVYLWGGKDNARMPHDAMRRRFATPLPAPAGPALLDLAESYRLRLRATRKSASTIRNYLAVLHILTDFLSERRLPLDVTRIRQEHLELFVIDQLERLTPGTAAARYGWLHTFFHWCVDVGELENDPMARMHKPAIPDAPPPIPAIDELRPLLKTCSGKDFASLRDLAIFYMLLDTGMRRSEVVNLTHEDVDMNSGRVTIRAKRSNGQDRTHYGRLTATSLMVLDAYKRVRRGHHYAAYPNIFIAQRGALTGVGIYAIVRRRAEQAGLDLRPHRVRPYFAPAWLAAGGS